MVDPDSIKGGWGGGGVKVLGTDTYNCIFLQDNGGGRSRGEDSSHRSTTGT